MWIGNIIDQIVHGFTDGLFDRVEAMVDYITGIAEFFHTFHDNFTGIHSLLDVVAIPSVSGFVIGCIALWSVITVIRIATLGFGA